MDKESAIIHVENSVIPVVKLEGKNAAMLVCWLLGIGSLLSWNTMFVAEDYYVTIFPTYHPTRVLTMVYQPFALGAMGILAYYEAKINTRRRILVGYIAFFLILLMVIILDLATLGKGGIGTFIGICCASAVFGAAQALVEGGMVGDLSLMCPEFVQSFLGGQSASGALISILRLLTKAAFDNSHNGLRKGALMFLAVCTFFELVCVILYAYIFAELPIVKYYRSKAASEGSQTVLADLAACGIQSELNQGDGQSEKTERLSSKQILIQNLDYAVDLIVTFTLTLSIFPGFLSEDTGSHSLGSWYVVVLIASFNMADLIGRYIPLIEIIKLKSRKGLMIATISRIVFVPAFYFTAKYGDQGWMIMLTVVLGLSNSYLTVCIFTEAPKGYKGPEQNALGNLLVLALFIGIFAGVLFDWLWLIGKGW